MMNEDVKGTQYPKMKDIFTRPYHVWSPKEIRNIRLSLGKSTAEFADWFVVSEDLVKAWEAPGTSRKHRECYGPAARLMVAAAELAEGKSANLIRLAASGNL